MGYKKFKIFETQRDGTQFAEAVGVFFIRRNKWSATLSDSDDVFYHDD